MNTYAKTILYADDDVDDRALLRQAVRDIDATYQIVEASDGIHALELLRQMKQYSTLPDLIILDINMPRMDGKQTLVLLQNDKVLASIPIILFSTSNSALDKMFCKAKNVELLTKPFDFTSLYNTANRLLSYCIV